MTKDDFLDLVDALRERGAIAIEAGDLKVAFDGPSLQTADLYDFEEELDEEADHAEASSAAHKQWLRDQYGSAG